MAFGREVHHPVWLEVGEEFRDRRGIADIGLRKLVARVLCEIVERMRVSRVGELIDVEHGVLCCGDEKSHEIAADKTSSASDEDFHEIRK